MDAQQSWSDFHFLNTAFRDVVEASTNVGAKGWIQTSLVRLSYRGGKDKDKTIHRTVKAIDGLMAEYAVPFPLTYIFQPATLHVYAEIFVFLLQIRRAKSVLERVLVRGEARAKALRAELKVFYAMRSRLSWFIKSVIIILQG
jgi:gamma-tubulin complex component 5